MIYQRQKLLIGLLDALGGKIPKTEFQKFLYLYTREEEDEPSYDFVPYKYGCFSFTSYADKRKLVQKGYIEEHEDSWQLIKNGVKLPVETKNRLHRFAKRHGEKRGNALIREVYTRFPETAWRSEIKNKVIQDPEILRRIDSARPVYKGRGLVTIGYEGKSLETYLNALLIDGATILCDVRRNALSRKYGFSKSTLSSACENMGIRYEHLPELGIDSTLRQNLKTQTDYNELFEVYSRKTLPDQKDSLEKIAQWVRDGERVALTCFELKPQLCHRHCVLTAVEKTLDFPCDVSNL